MKHLDNYSGAEPSPVVADTLTRRGGKTPLGFPIYRLVRSESVFEKVGGVWNEWDANLNQADRGGIAGEDGAPVATHHRPERVVAELREVQVYSHFDEHGWVLERWYPAPFFGSPIAWNENLVEGTDIPKFGPFPSTGRYLAIQGPFPRQPNMDYLEDYISFWESRRANFPDDVEQHIKQRTDAAIKRHEESSAHAIRVNQERLQASVAPLTSTSLEAGRWRSRMFERSGHHSHVGN